MKWSVLILLACVGCASRPMPPGQGPQPTWVQDLWGIHVKIPPQARDEAHAVLITPAEGSIPGRPFDPVVTEVRP